MLQEITACRLRRTALGITLAELAKILGTSVPALSLLERGQLVEGRRARRLRREISKILGQSVQELFPGQPVEAEDR